MTRRQFGRLALAAFVLPQVVGGVRLGVQTYSFRDLPRTPGGDAIDAVIGAMRACGLTECELFAPQVEPAPGRDGRDELRRWRLETPLDHFRGIGEKFRKAGIAIYAYNYSPNASFSDEEIDRGFEMTKALGAEIITASTQLDTARRIVPFAEKHQMVVAMHGHSNITDPNEFAKPESFEAALRMSPYFRINLDIGHFTAAGYDALPFIAAHRSQITNLHIKDMLRGKPDSYVPWGHGDAPITEVLRWLKRERSPIRAYIEYEYRGDGSPVEEVKKCLAYAKQALA